MPASWSKTSLSTLDTVTPTPPGGVGLGRVVGPCCGVMLWGRVVGPGCGARLGWVGFRGKQELDPIVWRIQWPPDIKKIVVSSANPAGTFTKLDLEMAGVILHTLVLETTMG
jgi:hypothetical protein